MIFVVVGSLISNFATLLGSHKIANDATADLEDRMTRKLEIIEETSIANSKKVLSEVSLTADAVDRNTVVTNLNAAATAILSNTRHLLAMVKHLVSDARSWSMTEPATEDIARNIYKLVEGYSKGKLQVLRQLTDGTTTIVTQMVKKTKDEAMCDRAKILKL